MSNGQDGFAGLTLVPSDDSIDPLADIAAAQRSALRDVLPAVVEETPEPTGYTWAFDFAAGRFIRHGQAPARVGGLEVVRQRCLMALNAARYAHPVFSSKFGVEGPQSGIGTAGAAARAEAERWKGRIRDALLVFDDVTDVQVDPVYDPLEGVILLRDLMVTTNEEVTLSFPDIRIDLDTES